MMAPVTSSIFGSFEGGFFIFLLAFALMYALLQKKMEKKDMAALISLSVAVILASTVYLNNLLMIAIPIIVGVIIFIFFFLLIASMMYGDMEASIPLKLKRTMVITAIVIIAFFVFWAMEPQFMTRIGGQIQAGLNGNITSNGPLTLLCTQTSNQTYSCGGG